MPEPMEVIATPLTYYLAPTATAFPLVDAAPAAEWVKVGTEGDLNYDDGGTSVKHSQTIETFTPAGATAPRKAFRTEEGLVLGVTLVDLSPEQWAKILDEATLVTTAAAAGIPGEKRFAGLRGPNVHNWALLARGQSTVDNTLNLQIEIPTVFQSADPSPVFTKGKPAALELEFTALEVTAGEFYEIAIQTAEATP